MDYLDNLDYELYLAERNLNASLVRCHLESLNASPSEYAALNESFKESIIGYINKVTASVQKVWDNFKGKYDKARVEKLFVDYAPVFASGAKTTPILLPVDFDVPVIDAWDSINNAVKLEELTAANYNSLKDELENPNDYIKSKYKEFYDEKLSIYEKFEERAFHKSRDGEALDRDGIEPMREFMLNYGDQLDLIQQDLDKVNNSNKNVENMLNTILASANEASNIGDILLDFITEDQTTSSTTTTTVSTSTGTGNDNGNSNKFRSTDPNIGSKGGGEKSKDRKYIVNYYKASTKVISAKLRLCNKINGKSFTICQNFAKLQNIEPVNAKKKTEPNQNASAERKPEQRTDRVNSIK